MYPNEYRHMIRARLLAAAHELFDEYGFDDTSVEMIADRAGVSRRTFYRYFPSKDGLLADYGGAVVETALQELPPAPDLDDLIRALAKALQATVDESGPLLLRLLREQSRLAERAMVWRQDWATQLADGLASAQQVQHASLQHVAQATAAVHCLAVAIDEWLRTPEGDLLDAAEQVAQALRGRERE